MFILGYMAVVPYYFLVWYNHRCRIRGEPMAVVPYYFLVWYNQLPDNASLTIAVVPYYFLVWYNPVRILSALQLL